MDSQGEVQAGLCSKGQTAWKGVWQKVESQEERGGWICSGSPPFQEPRTHGKKWVLGLGDYIFHGPKKDNRVDAFGFKAVNKVG